MSLTSIYLYYNLRRVLLLSKKIATKHKVFAAIYTCKQKLLITLVPLWHLGEEKAIFFPATSRKNFTFVSAE